MDCATRTQRCRGRGYSPRTSASAISIPRHRVQCARDDDLAKPKSAEVVTDHREEGFERRRGPSRPARWSSPSRRSWWLARMEPESLPKSFPSQFCQRRADDQTPVRRVRRQALRPARRRGGRRCGARAARSQELGAPRGRDCARRSGCIRIRERRGDQPADLKFHSKTRHRDLSAERKTMVGPDGREDRRGGALRRDLEGAGFPKRIGDDLLDLVRLRCALGKRAARGKRNAGPTSGDEGSR